MPAPADLATWFPGALDRARAAPVQRSREVAVAGRRVVVSASSAAVADVVLAGLVDGPPRTGGGSPGAAPGRSGRWWALDGRHVALPPPPFAPADLRPRDGVAGADVGRYRMAWAIERQVLWALDLERGEGLVWLRDPALAAPWDRAAPWRPLLAWWLPTVEAALVHAAAVAPPGRPDLGCLLVGAGGAGKSTLALACGQVGWTVTGDDYVVLAPRDADGGDPPGWGASAAYRWAKADPATIERLALPDAWLVPGIDHLGKALVDLPTAFGGGGGAPVGLHAAVIPHRAGATGDAAAAPPSAFVAAAGPSTVLQTPGDASAVLGVLAAAGGDLPTHTLAVGPDVGTTGPAALERLLLGAGVGR